MNTILFFLFAAISSVLYVLFIYNYLSFAAEDIRKNKANISIELDRRFKVFESLVNINFRYLEQRNALLKEFYYVKKLSKKDGSEDNEDLLAKQKKIDLDKEHCQYIHNLQKEIISTEDRLAEAKKLLNKSVCTYKYVRNFLLCSFILDKLNPGLDINFSYWDVSKEEKLEKENYSIHM